METENLNSISETSPPAGPPAVRIFGVGNAGIALLGDARHAEFAEAEFAVINTDGRLPRRFAGAGQISS
jgi:hypothetical protein